MAHPQQAAWCLKVRERYPFHFRGGRRVLDVGSLDINGSNAGLFVDNFGDDAWYTGVDVVPGKNVDLLAPVHMLAFRDGYFDTIISTEAFEHDLHLPKTLRNIVRMLASSGLFVFTCATTGRPEHGTTRSKPWDAPGLPWADYYCNVTEAMVREAIDVDAIFSEYEFSIGHETCDLYFSGIKR